MKMRTLFPIFLLLSSVFNVVSAEEGATSPAASESPLYFIENKGQFDPQVRFQAVLDNGRIWLTNDALWLTLTDDHQTLHLKLPLNGSPQPFGRVDTAVSYLGGGLNRPQVPVWSGVRYAGLEVSGGYGRMTLTPTDAFTSSAIDGPATAVWDENGLHLTTPLGPIHIPYHITASTSVSAESSSHLVYSTFIGGNNTEEGYALAVDDNGDSYVTGYTSATNFPTAVGLYPTTAHGVDAYVAKLQADGTAVDYILWINPNPEQPDDEDYGKGIAVDANGNAYVAGRTKSSEFCAFVGNPPGYDTTYNGNTDAYALKINATGTALDYCTYLGGNDLDQANAIAIDSSGNAYIGGGTWSTDFPTTAGVYGPTLIGQRDTFIAKLNPSGTSLLYATYIGGSGQDEIRALDIDSSGNVYTTGWVNSSDYPTTAGVISTSYNGGFDLFLTKLNATATSLIYSTYIGGTAQDRAYGLRVDNSGMAYVAGITQSATFPVTMGAYDTVFGGGTCDFDICYDAFVAKVNATASAINYATFVGDNSTDEGYALDIDGNGRVYLTGLTQSATFPTTADAYDSTYNGDDDAFLAILSADGSALDYASFLGDTDTDRGFGIAVIAPNDIYLTGQTRSAAFPTTAGAYDITQNGDYDIYALHLYLGDAVTGLTAVNDSPTTLGQTTTLTATISTGTDVTYTWDFGDGVTQALLGGDGATTSHTYAASGNYTAAVTATNPAGSQTTTTAVTINCLAPVIPSVTINLAMPGVLLAWANQPVNSQYEIWRDVDPYFLPFSLPLATISADSYHDTSSETGNPAINDYYLVRAVNDCGQNSLFSNRIGEFDFAIQPGTP